jgi:prevent-host-death family protein
MEVWIDIMTISDYLMTMRSVNIAELKAKLSEYLRHVRSGHELTVLDRNTPVARLVPFDEGADRVRTRRPMRKHPSLQSVPLPPPLQLEFDIVDVLQAERQGER